MNPLQIIEKYYCPDSEVYKIVVKHSSDVAEKALRIAKKHPDKMPDADFIYEAAMLHDIGIFLTDAPEIGCRGSMPYICHGYLGADLLRAEGLPQHARVCERHTGTGLSLETILANNLPLPHRDLQPETWAEKLICFADKFYSKTHLNNELSIEKIREKMHKYGQDTLNRFDEWVRVFSY